MTREDQALNWLALEVNGLLKDFVRCRNDFGIRLVPALRNDHVDEFSSHVHIREFQGAAGHLASSAVARDSDAGITRRERSVVSIGAQLQEAAGVVEHGQRQACDFGGLTIAENTLNCAVTANDDIGNCSGRIPVLTAGRH